MRTAAALMVAMVWIQIAMGQELSSVATANRKSVVSARTAVPESPLAVRYSSSRPAALDSAVDGIAPNMPVAAPAHKRESHYSVRTWYTLTAIQHGAAVFDAWTTRRAVRSGAPELNPVLRPIAGTNAVYPALQLMPLVTDFIGLKMMHSHNSVLRRIWWLSQAVGIAGSTASGFINLQHYRQ